jgi:PhnB protein
MLADDCEDEHGPQTRPGRSVSLYVLIPEVDAAFDKAVAAGVKVIRPVADQFYGNRTGMLEDPFGHVWTLATHKEDVSPEEMQRRAAKLFAGDKT